MCKISYERINLGKVTIDSVNGVVEGEILLDSKVVGEFLDNHNSGEMDFYFDNDEVEETFYNLTDKYKGLGELQQEIFIGDLLKKVLNI